MSCTMSSTRRVAALDHPRSHVFALQCKNMSLSAPLWGPTGPRVVLALHPTTTHQYPPILIDTSIMQQSKTSKAATRTAEHHEE